MAYGMTPYPHEGTAMTHPHTVRNHTPKQIARWTASAAKRVAKINDVEHLRRLVRDVPQVLANMDRGRRDQNNSDWQWCQGQHLVFSCAFEAYKARLAELEDK